MKRHIKITSQLSRDHKKVTITSVRLSAHKGSFGNKHEHFPSYGTIFFDAPSALLCSWGNRNIISSTHSHGKLFVQFPGYANNITPFTTTLTEYEKIRDAVNAYNEYYKGDDDAEAHKSDSEALAEG